MHDFYTRADQRRGERRLVLLAATVIALLLGLALGVNLTMGAVPTCL